MLLALVLGIVLSRTLALSLKQLSEAAKRAATGDLDDKAISLTVEAAPDLPEIEVDKDRILQVFRNILENAVRFTPENGEIALSCVLDAGLGIIIQLPAASA